MYTALQVIITLIGIVMIILIMLRKGESGGLSSAFGGAGDTAFGVKSQKQLDKVITYVAIAFISAAILMNYMNRSKAKTKPKGKVETKQPVKPKGK